MASASTGHYLRASVCVLVHISAFERPLGGALVPVRCGSL